VPRLFLAIDLPDAIDFDIQIMAGGIPGARWQTAEQLHLTLHFLGDVDGGDARRLEAALAELDAPSFRARLQGAGVFPLRGPARVLWLGLADPDPIRLVHERSGRIIDALGLDRERRKYVPHVTVARLQQADERRLGAWVADHLVYESPPFEVRQVQLLSSVLTQAGPKYRVEAVYPLQDPDVQVD
jgi:RNA 2',3'-cyclic 3'-phosphodiesterase